MEKGHKRSDLQRRPLSKRRVRGPARISAENEKLAVLIRRYIPRASAKANGEVVVGRLGQARIVSFAMSYLAKLDREGFPPGVDQYTLRKQVISLMPEFLESVREEARRQGALKFGVRGQRYLPADIIEQQLPIFMAKRCHCWPQ